MFAPGQLVVISPHLDDGVFSCGALLAASPGARVLTVFAGVPPRAEHPTEWDRACGLGASQDAVRTRRAEDRAALALLEAAPLWLDFPDSQYGETFTCNALAAAIRDVLLQLRPQAAVLPFGLFHADHAVVHAAVVSLLSAISTLAWYAYEDMPYRSLPGLLQQRLSALDSQGVKATPTGWDVTDQAARKQRALEEYRSQLRGLDQAWGAAWRDDLCAPERCWRLERAAS